MSDTVTATRPAVIWLDALLVRRRSWPPEDRARFARVARTLERAGIALHVFDPPPRGGPAGAVDTRAQVERVLADLADRGIGPGLVGAIGRLPGLSGRVVRYGGGLDVLRTVAEQQVALRAAGGVPDIDRDPAWTLTFTGVDLVLERVEEALLTLADGWFGTRGAVEEDGGGADPGVFAGGVYTDGDGGPVGDTPTLLPGPLWAQLAVPTGGALSRTLDLRTGTLLRESPATEGSPLRILRFASLARPGTAVLWAEGPSEMLDTGPGLVAAPGTAPPGTAAQVDGDPAHVRATAASPVGWIEADATTETRELGRRRSVLRRVRLRSSSCVASLPAATDEVAGPERLLDEHRRAWTERWRAADVEIDGDPALQLAVRFGLFHLMASVPSTGEAAVGARGLTGRAYRGHVFWDADVFVLPFLAATHPAAARAMLAYRVARLPAARVLAGRAGHPGARFPWESAHDGRDVTPTSATDLDGHEVRIATGRYQEHITADVAWAASHYLDWSGDRTFERTGGRSLLFETARYWRSRVTIGSDGRGHLREVMGPDEYHAPVDDDAFTNGMTRWNLRRAAAAVRRDDPPHLHREAAAWTRVADQLVDGYDPVRGRHEQFEGYDQLAAVPELGHLAAPVAADVLFGVARTAASQVIKQADVLMLHHLVPRHCPRGSLVRDLEHYLPRTAHGSSLSPGVHASLLARAGRPDEALELLRYATEVDLRDLTGSTAGGVHLAAAGSVWQALAFGFLGLWPGAAGTVDIDPHLPTAWDSLTVRVTSHGRPMVIHAGHERLVVHAPRPVPVRVGNHLSVAGPTTTEFRRSAVGWHTRGG